MSDPEARTAICECGHTWPLRKPVAEMTDGPRCSNCGAVGEAITITHDEPAHTGEDQHHSDILQTVERRATRESLVERVEANCERVETLTSGDDRVPQELAEPYRRFTILLEELRDDESIPLDELRQIEAYIESLETELDECPEVSELKDLEFQIEARRNERQRLNEEIATLEEQRDELESAHRDLRDLWKHAQSNAHMFRRGLREGFEHARQHPNARPWDMIGEIDFPADEAATESETNIV